LASRRSSRNASFPTDDNASSLLSRYDDYVMEKYSTEPDRQSYSWGTMAAAQRLATTSDSRFVEFIGAQASHFVDREFPTAQRRENTCALVEGLAAAAGVLFTHDGDRALLQRLMTRIDREMTKNRALQILPGTTQLDYPGGSFFRSMRLGVCWPTKAMPALRTTSAPCIIRARTCRRITPKR